MTIPAVLFVDNFGRKPMLMLGEANMAVSHATIAAIVATYGGTRLADGTYTPFRNKAAGNGAVFMVSSYRHFVFWPALNLGLLVHHLVRYDLGPTRMGRIRRGIPPWHACQGNVHLIRRQLAHEWVGKAWRIEVESWLSDFTVAEVTPIMFDNIGYKTYIVFMCFCVTGFLYAWLILPELKGLSLEQVDAIFKDNSGAEDRERRERIAKQIGLDKLAANVQHKEGGEKAVNGSRFEGA
jgi:hypothetical protein